jgi:hypothetical protein
VRRHEPGDDGDELAHGAARLNDSDLQSYAEAAADGNWASTWDVLMLDDGSIQENYVAHVERVLSKLERMACLMAWHV